MKNRRAKLEHCSSLCCTNHPLRIGRKSRCSFAWFSLAWSEKPAKEIAHNSPNNLTAEHNWTEMPIFGRKFENTTRNDVSCRESGPWNFNFRSAINKPEGCYQRRASSLYPSNRLEHDLREETDFHRRRIDKEHKRRPIRTTIHRRSPSHCSLCTQIIIIRKLQWETRRFIQPSQAEAKERWKPNRKI